MEIEQHYHPILLRYPAASPSPLQNISSANGKMLVSEEGRPGLSAEFMAVADAPPPSSPPREKLEWVRSQIIGRNARFLSPFGRRWITYADHTASGKCLRYIESFVVSNVLPYYGNTHTSDSYVGHRTTKMVHEAAEYIKQSLGGGPETALLFCGSGATGSVKRIQEVMGIAVPSILRRRVLSFLPCEERWVVFVGPFEHHSNLLSWRQSLAEVVEIGLDADGLLDMEALKQKLEHFREKNRPLLGSFSACSNVTGIYLDTRAMAKLLHSYGAFACFDFAASGPYVEIDMRPEEDEGYDAVFLSGHKFLGGPGSPGILLMKKSLYLLGSSPPSTCGGGTVDYVNGLGEQCTVYTKDIEDRENAGTPPIIQIIRASLAFQLKAYVGFDVIKELEDRYIAEALRRLIPNRNVEILGNRTVGRLAILSFLIYTRTCCRDSKEEEGVAMCQEINDQRDKPLHGQFVATLLNDLFGIQARGGCICAGPYGHALLQVSEAQSLALKSAIEKGYLGVKTGWTRVSFSYYMSQEEFEFVLDALEFLADYGQRFLPLYHFDLKTGSWTFKKEALVELVKEDGINSCSFRVLQLVGAIQSTEIEVDPTCDSNSKKITAYSSYLEFAKHVASLLPKFPMQRDLTEEADLNFSCFRT
ncbi:hypothetical protein SAY86_013597 [Trapa natans]|uniref:Aminotransferase class V domain-containing protein n=1 Tax=Trapa natans TaxID=22666 RepID=A0AAN7KR98_TRANT|nr:hypothetical protein SAY86_013597 [Trapa natans]